MASGLARGAAARGKRIAFGDCKKIRWDQNSAKIFQGNPNVAPPGTEQSGNLEWIRFYKGNRIYNTHDLPNNRWIWNYEFKAIPGEIFLTREERVNANKMAGGFVIIEPNVPAYKSCAVNKQWSTQRYCAVTLELQSAGYDVVQFNHGVKGFRIPTARRLYSPDFRHAMSVMQRAALYIGPEGGLHHAAAAVGLSAVVLFGGFIPPAVTGYTTHTNLTGGVANEDACGSLSLCRHCKAAMAAISVNEVMESALKYLKPPVLECSSG